MTIASYIQEIGAGDHKLAMRDLKPLSSMGPADYAEFWPVWEAIIPMRRAEIAQAMVELSEDNIDLEFNETLLWLLNDEDAAVRASAAGGLWESDNPQVLHRLLDMLQSDPAPSVRAAVAISLGHFSYLAALGELDEDERVLREGLLRAIRDQRQPLDVRRRAIESAGYFSADEEVQGQIQLAYESNEQLLQESALVAMGRSMLRRWLPMVGRELVSPSPALRYEAARAAGELAEDARSLVPRLATLITDEDTEVAFAAIWALGQIGGAPAKRALQQIRKGQDDARRQAAADALDELSLGDESPTG